MDDAAILWRNRTRLTDRQSSIGVPALLVVQANATDSGEERTCGLEEKDDDQRSRGVVQRGCGTDSKRSSTLDPGCACALCQTKDEVVPQTKPGPAMSRSQGMDARLQN